MGEGSQIGGGGGVNWEWRGGRGSLLLYSSVQACEQLRLHPAYDS